MAQTLFAAQIVQVELDFWTRYGAGCIAFAGFLIHSVVTYGAAQKLAGKREETIENDKAWKLAHEAQSNGRDVAIAALQAMGNTTKATVEGIQTQLSLIQNELQELRNRAGMQTQRK